MSLACPRGADLSRLVHDLRGPLMPLRTAAWLLRNELGDSDRARELVDIVDRQSARLARMMDELSEWGRSSGDRLVLHPRAVDVGLALDMAIGATPDCRSEPRYAGASATAALQLDPQLFDQLLHTLIAHAMQRQDGASPEIEVWQDDTHLHLRVRDEGVPLDAAQRETLFDTVQPAPFDDGLGLRLMLARRIAEAHHGRLAVEAHRERGLAVLCSLPLAP